MVAVVDIAEIVYEELKRKYLESKSKVEILQNELDKVSPADTVNYLELEDELGCEQDYMKEIAVEIADLVCRV